MAKELHYEIVDTNSGQALGSVWWDSSKGKIQASNESVLSTLYSSHSGVGMHGKSLLENLPRVFRSGYLSVRRAKGE